MKRIIFLIFRLLYRIPGWLLTIHRYNKIKRTSVLRKDSILFKNWLEKSIKNQEFRFIVMVKRIYLKNRVI